MHFWRLRWSVSIAVWPCSGRWAENAVRIDPAQGPLLRLHAPLSSAAGSTRQPGEYADGWNLCFMRETSICRLKTRSPWRLKITWTSKSSAMALC